MPPEINPLVDNNIQYRNLDGYMDKTLQYLRLPSEIIPKSTTKIIVSIDNTTLNGREFYFFISEKQIVTDVIIPNISLRNGNVPNSHIYETTNIHYYCTFYFKHCLELSSLL